MHADPLKASRSDLPMPSELLFLQFQAWHTALEVTSGLWRGAALMTAEVMGLAAHRLTEDARTLQALAREPGTSPMERVQRQWLKAAMADYGKAERDVEAIEAHAMEDLAAPLAQAWVLSEPEPKTSQSHSGK